MADSRFSGRDLRIKPNGTDILACVNTKTITYANEAIDVTGDCDDGFVTVLERAGSSQITFDASGFTQDETIRDDAVKGAVYYKNALIEYLAGDGSGDVIYTVTADLWMGSFSETGATDGGLEFSASFASSGATVGAVPTSSEG